MASHDSPDRLSTAQHLRQLVPCSIARTTAMMIDREQLGDFVASLFRYADPDTFVSLRAFDDGEDGKPPFALETVKLNGSELGPLVEQAARLAQRCADADQRIVFCPPVATFRTGASANQQNVANGLALSVECDARPEAARARLEGLLGRATIVVASGGEWTDPDTGEAQDKLHLYWRLTEPTREPGDHDRLKHLRRLAQRLVGADGTNVPLVHPIRWPGSWHRKSTPRLARIVAKTESEIDLADAIEMLDAACSKAGLGEKTEAQAEGSGELQADPRDIAVAVAAVPNGDLPWDEWNRIGMAIWAATGGDERGFASFDAWSQKSSKYDAATTRERWQHFAKHPPNRIGAGTLFHLAKEAQPGFRISAPKRMADRAAAALLLDPSAPLASARIFIERLYMHEGARTLHHHGERFLAWRRSHYAVADEAAMRAKLYDFLDRAERPLKGGGTGPFNPTRGKVNNVGDALAAEVNLPADVRAPAWLGKVADLPPAGEIIACANGLLHVPARRLLPHTPLFFGENAVEFSFHLDAPAPRSWLAFLASVWPEDAEAIATLQEVFGYALTGDTRQQKLFLMTGPKRSGKGTIARVLTALLGPDNVVSPTLAGLGSQFGLAPLIGKQLAIIADARLGGKADQQVIAERLLSISGEDALTVDRKFLSAWTGRLATRFFILTNELPRLTDASGALASRFVVLTMTRSFYGTEDHGLTNRLIAELPGIFNWALAGLDRLRKRGHFVPPKSSDEAIAELEDLGSPIGAFLRECCTVEPGAQIDTNLLFEAWEHWCQEQGRDKPGTKQTFGRDLRAAIPSLSTVRPRDDDHDRIRRYQGIRLSSDGDALVARQAKRSFG